jgi:hypothetical protein
MPKIMDAVSILRSQDEHAIQTCIGSTRRLPLYKPRKQAHIIVSTNLNLNREEATAHDATILALS